MSNVLVLLEAHGAEVRKTSLNGISFAQNLLKHTGGKLHLAIIGDKSQAAAQQVAAFGAEKIWVVEDAAYSHYLTESYTQALSTIAQKAQASCVAAISSSLSKDLMPRLSARLGAAMATDVLSVVDAKPFTRPMWAGNVIATVELTTDTKVMTVRGTEFEVPKAAGSTSPIEKVAVPCDLGQLKAHFEGLKEVKSERLDVATAERVVSGGRGVKGPEGFAVIEQLADALGAGVGASRAVCDAGWVPNDLQIGQTGKIVAPNLYIACGISGAIQHLAGMKGSKVIVAINKDPEAPIFQVADFGLVADLFTAVPQMVQGLKH